MKLTTLLATLVLATSLQAQTIQDANNLFALRGEDTNNAKKAADIYGTLAANSGDKLEKGNLLSQQGLSLYFYATRQKSENERERLHKIAFGIADNAVKTLTNSNDIFNDTPYTNTQEAKTALALAHYTSAINMGKWAEARGVLASLGQWGNMKKHLDAVIKNDETVEDYGAYRTFGRAWLKLPFTHGGSKKKSLRDLKYAYDKTFNEDYLTSANSTTTLYYLDTLVARNVTGDAFCDVYLGMADLAFLSDEELAEINPNKVPEFKSDIVAFDNGSEFEEDVHDHANKQGCPKN